MSTPAPQVSDRAPLRLSVGDHPVPRAHLDGAWWPQSRDLAVEVADLVDHFPDRVGQVRRLLYSRPDWDPDASGSWARRVPVRRGYVKVGSFPSDDTHVMVVALTSGARLHLLVVPSSFEASSATAAMTAAADQADGRTAADLLRVTEHDQAHPGHDAWDDDGGH